LIKNRKRRNKERRNIILEHYGARCACCGETTREFLTIDHKNNDGARHKKELKTRDPQRVYKWIIDNNFPNTFQILCYNCNCAKGVYGYCPHQSNIIPYTRD
jgi:hypothetical protein